MLIICENREIIDVISWSLIKKCKVNTEDFFLSIGGLAVGRYSIVLKQFNDKNKLLLKTEHIEFHIKGQQTVYGNVRPVNIIK